MGAATRSRLVPDLPRRAWIVLGADGISALGNGLILPFLVIYLRDVRGFRIEIVGLVLSTVAVAGLAAAPLTGGLIDRIGPRRMLMFALTCGATASASAIFVTRVWEAFAWATVFGLSIAAMWPSAHSMLAAVVEKHHRSAVYSVHFAMLNAGIGLGALLGGLIADVERPGTFAIIFFLDALTFAVYAIVLAFVRAGERPMLDDAEPNEVGGWRRVARDRVFMRVCLLSTILIVIGYAQLSSTFPAFATEEGGISTRALGAVFAVNTVVIVALQLVILRRLTGRLRTRALMVVCYLWAVAWLVTLGAGTIGGGLVAVMGFMVASGVFAIGETYMQASLPALVNDLAPDDIRGRYNAAYSVTWSVGNIVGPAVGGFFLGAQLSMEFFLLLALACASASIYALRLERYVGMEANRVAASLSASS